MECDGIDDLATAQELVGDGDAVALVSATITARPGPVWLASRLVPVEEFSLLAGQLPSGSVKEVEESAANESSNVLEPGSYLLLLGETWQETIYFLSDGRRGSFQVVGDEAYQRCPNYADPDHPWIVRTGITDIEELTSLFAVALSGR